MYDFKIFNVFILCFDFFFIDENFVIEFFVDCGIVLGILFCFIFMRDRLIDENNDEC